MRRDKNILQKLGYSPKESEFLYLVALHSGYFLQRHYHTYYQVKKGYPILRLTNRLHTHKHGRAHLFGKGTFVYQVFSRNIYRLLDLEHVGFRKPHGREYIKTKLLTLDFVINHREVTYLATESQKVDYFTQLGIDREFLPAQVYKAWNHRSETTHYFVDKFPLYLKRSENTLPVVSFTYIDPGFAGIGGFITHLEKYQSLFSELQEFNMTYVSDDPKNFLDADRYFSQYVTAHLSSPPQPAPYSLSAVMRYFELQAAFDDKQWKVFTIPVVEEYNAKKELFRGAVFKGLYQKYRAGALGESHLSAALTQIACRTGSRKIHFETYQVIEPYDLFGECRS